MKEQVINEIIRQMLPHMDNAQTKQLKDVLDHALYGYDVVAKNSVKPSAVSNDDLVAQFLEAKHIEGRSEKTLNYYRMTIKEVLAKIGKDVLHIDTTDLRHYLTEYQSRKGVSQVTLDNVRRILNSFFKWLEDEDYLIKSPMRRIHKGRIPKTVKEAFTEDALETMRNNCTNLRDLAMINFLASTGVRVGELVLLNRDDINFNERECIVLGKGNKERVVYFDTRTKLHLQNYLNSRTDDSPALFTSLKAPHGRLEIGAIDTRIRAIGRKFGITKVHPHRFRRTMATVAIDKGMPIEQLQQILGHKEVDTTLLYAIVKQSNVKLAHRKYLE